MSPHIDELWFSSTSLFAALNRLDHRKLLGDKCNVGHMVVPGKLARKGIVLAGIPSRKVLCARFLLCTKLPMLPTRRAEKSWTQPDALGAPQYLMRERRQSFVSAIVKSIRVLDAFRFCFPRLPASRFSFQRLLLSKRSFPRSTANGPSMIFQRWSLQTAGLPVFRCNRSAKLCGFVLPRYIRSAESERRESPVKSAVE